MKKILLNNLISIAFVFVLTISLGSLYPQKAFAGWIDNLSVNNYNIGYSVTIPQPIVDVVIDKNSINIGGEVKIIWKSLNISSATYCKGKITKAGVLKADSDFTGGLRENSVGLYFYPQVPTTYNVKCYNDIPALGTCHGTYTTPNGYCGTVGVIVQGSVGPYGELPGPYEGDLCSDLNQNLCGSGWIVHPCSLWHVTSPTTVNCSTIATQSACAYHSSCSWY